MQQRMQQYAVHIYAYLAFMPQIGRHVYELRGN